jgi:hypothetical protein
MSIARKLMNTKSGYSAPTLTYVGASQTLAATSLEFTPDGSYFFQLDYSSKGSEYLYKYPVPTAWDISSINSAQREDGLSVSGYGISNNISLNEDGTKLFTGTASSWAMLSLSPAYGVTNISLSASSGTSNGFIGSYYSPYGQSTTNSSIGTFIYANGFDVVYGTESVIDPRPNSTAAIQFSANPSWSHQAVTYGYDGMVAYVALTNTSVGPPNMRNYLHIYLCSSPYDITTGDFVEEYELPELQVGASYTAYDMATDPSNEFLYITTNQRVIHQYAME